MPPLRRFAALLLILLTVAYPLVVYLAMGHIDAQWLAFMLAALAAARALLTQQQFWWIAAAGAGLLAALSWWQGTSTGVKLYPVMVSLVLLCVFAYSLWKPPTVVERLARLQEPELPPQAVHYTAQVTKVWCLFFIGNAAASGYTVYWGSDALWALYNGVVSYVLMGLLMSVEWLVRLHVRRKHPR